MIGEVKLFPKDGLVNSAHEAAGLFVQTPDALERAVERAINNATRDLDAIIAIDKDSRTFKNTVFAIDETSRQCSIVIALSLLLEMVSVDKSMRDCAQKQSLKIRGFAIDAFSSKNLYKAFRQYLEISKDSLENLIEEESYLLQEMTQDFELAGLQLPDVEFEQVKVLKKELSGLSAEFSKNIAVASSESKLLLNPSDLAGVSDSLLEQLPKDDNGKCIVGVDYPTYTEIMGYCNNGETRKQLSTLFLNRAYPANKTLLEKIVSLRADLASLLGFGSYAELDLSSQMGGHPDKIETFLNDVLGGVSKKAAEELDVFLKNLPDGIELNEKGELLSWDVSFVKKQYEKTHLEVDDREVAKYFPLSQTLERLFTIYQDFLDLDFSMSDAKNVWHEDVKLIQVRQKGQSNVVGYLYLDLHPRAFKYSHACHLTIVPGIDRAGQGGDTSYPAVSVVIANFPKKVGDVPALLKHDDVVTFFHEFGHAMHGILGRTAYAEFSGTSVKRDFVETPSQMFEEWMWEPEVLQFVSGHFETGDPLPKTLLDSMIILRKSSIALGLQRQVGLALFSLRAFAHKNINPDELWGKVFMQTSQGVASHPDGHFYASFGHLTGYAAKYYGYLWTKVFAIDLFAHVQAGQGSLLSDGPGAKRVRALLQAGGRRHPSKLLHDFLGREPSQKAFFSKL